MCVRVGCVKHSMHLNASLRLTVQESGERGLEEMKKQFVITAAVEEKRNILPI